MLGLVYLVFISIIYVCLNYVFLRSPLNFIQLPANNSYKGALHEQIARILVAVFVS